MSVSSAHPVHHRARPEEQAALEEGVGDEVEHAGPPGAGADADEHEAELAHGGVGEHLLDVGLDEGDERREERGERADDRDRRHGGRGEGEEVRVARHEVDAGGDHGRRVDEGGDRGRARHRVGEPHVERELGGLAAGADEEAEQREGDGGLEGPAREEPALDRGGRIELAGHPDELLVARRAEDREEGEQADEEAEVADAVRHERLAAGERLLRVGVPEPDEQVAAEADALPPDEGEDERVAEDEREHRRDEQVQVREEPGEPRVVLMGHVRHGVDVDERPHAGDDHDHHAGEAIDEQAPPDRDEGAPVLGGDPEPVVPAEVEDLALRRPVEGEGRHEERADHRADRDEGDVSPPDASPEEPVHEGAREREQDDGPQIGLCRCRRGYDGGHKSGAKDYLLAGA
jgi:hypothetical protein